MNADPIKEIVSFAKFGALPIFADLLCDVTCNRFCHASEVAQFSANLGKPTFHA
jgi:hypothetical protein